MATGSGRPRAWRNPHRRVDMSCDVQYRTRRLRADVGGAQRRYPTTAPDTSLSARTRRRRRRNAAVKGLRQAIRLEVRHASRSLVIVPRSLRRRWSPDGVWYGDVDADRIVSTRPRPHRFRPRRPDALTDTDLHTRSPMVSLRTRALRLGLMNVLGTEDRGVANTPSKNWTDTSMAPSKVLVRCTSPASNATDAALRRSEDRGDANDDPSTTIFRGRPSPLTRRRPHADASRASATG